jgi:hypothetical protein
MLVAWWRWGFALGWSLWRRGCKRGMVRCTVGAKKNLGDSSQRHKIGRVDTLWRHKCVRLITKLNLRLFSPFIKSKKHVAANRFLLKLTLCNFYLATVQFPEQPPFCTMIFFWTNIWNGLVHTIRIVGTYINTTQILLKQLISAIAALPHFWRCISYQFVVVVKKKSIGFFRSRSKRISLLGNNKNCICIISILVLLTVKEKVDKRYICLW